MAMSATLAIGRDRATGESQSLYSGQGNRIKGMAKIWKDTKAEYRQTLMLGKPDASVLLKAEPNIRRNFSRIMLKTSVKYGNREKKRKKRGEGNQEYLNRIWDYAGARLRDVVKARYRFPTPSEIVMPNGEMKTGYAGSAKIPVYPLRHNHLPELDFGDMIRSHLMELGRQCLRYSVPMRAAKTRIDELAERLMPFLDYVYTERRTGKKHFIREGLRELRRIVNRIRTQYGVRNGRSLSITGAIFEEKRDAKAVTAIQLDEYPDDPENEAVGMIIGTDEEAESEPSDDLSENEVATSFFDVLLQRAEAEGIDEWKDFIKALRAHISNGIMTEEDVKEILRDAVEESRRIGVAFHNFISRGFPTAARLSSIVYHGKESIYDKSGYLMVSELNVESGRGRPDLVLFGNKVIHRIDESPSKTIFTPLMVVELKTRSSFDLDIYGAESKSREENNVVSDFVLDRRRMTDEEWESVLSGVPSEIDTAQVDAYNHAILNEYRRVMWKDTTAPENLVQAVIVVDSKENWGMMREALHSLVLDVYQRAMDGNLSEGEVFRPTLNESSLRMALRVISSGRPSSGAVPITAYERFEPFLRRGEDDNREFILYLTIPGRGSPAQSAASIAERWHGFKYLYEEARYKHRDIVWFDLTGEYEDLPLTRQRFYVAHHNDSVKRFFKNRVQFVNLFPIVYQCLHGGRTLENLRAEVKSCLGDSRRPIVVVSGWDSIWRSTPESLKGTLSEFVKSIFTETSRGSTILWFGRPVPVSKKSSVYETRCVAPFYSNTHWENFVDRIVWNVPWPPPRFGFRVPADDHLRLLIEELPGEDSPELKEIVVDPLEGWGETFRSGGKRRVYAKGVGTGVGPVALLTQRGRDSVIDLIAHLHSAPPDDIVGTLADYEIDQLDVPMDPSKDLGLSARITLRPHQYLDRVGRDGRIKRLLPIEEVDRKRDYRDMELGTEEPKRSTKPPSESYLVAQPMNDREIAFSEIQALRRTLRLLVNMKRGEHDWENLIERLTEMVLVDEPSVSDRELMNKLRLVRQTLETDSITRDSWKKLWPFRSRVPSSLDSDQQKHLQTQIQKHPDVFAIIGNHLFLLILAALGEGESITYTKTLEDLWEYVKPWHLIGLGLRPRYPEKHNTGESVLHRRNVLTHLRKRATNLNAILDQRETLSNVRFGELIIPERSGSAQSVVVWLIFQCRPGSQQINAAMVSPRGASPELKPRAILRFFVSGKTFWTESDISSLSFHSEPQITDERLPVMVADYKGLQALWFLDRERGEWLPVGRIDYTTRQYEDVTLVRTLTLRADPDIRPLTMNDVQWTESRLRDSIHTARSIIWVGFGGCVRAQCHVSLDLEENLFSIVFTDQDGEPLAGCEEPSRLLVDKTVDLLEILRRSDNECEPVVIDRKRMIWNRFTDIRYSNDTMIIRPWVERRAPLGQLPLGLPPTAHDLLAAEPDVEFKLVPYHDAWTCPLRNISLEDIREERKKAALQSSEYLFRFVAPSGQPARISNESGLSHGSCWQVEVHSVHDLPNEVRTLGVLRMTDSQLASFLSSREVSYWSEEKKQWVTHSFSCVYRREFISQAQESWHLKRLIEGALKLEKALVVPGTYLDPAIDWEPYFNIELEYVLVGLRLRGVDERREVKMFESAMALKERDEVINLLNNTMKKLLKRYTMTPDRKLQAKIRRELDFALDEAGVTDDGGTLELVRVFLKMDSAGGECLFVELKRTDGNEYPVQLTGHIHSLTWGEPVSLQEIEEFVDTGLSLQNVSGEDKERIVKECGRLLRSRGYM